ncbi:MAG: hypothetical protein AAF719_07705 [Pseudomonadota bacterium]
MPVERVVLDLSTTAYAQTGSEPLERDALYRLVKRVEIRPGALAVVVDLSAVGEDADRRIETTFTLKRRGVETRLVHKGDVRPPDIVLVRRVIRAMGWVDQIKRGASISDVAKADRVSGEFVTQNIDAGFLSPALLDAVIEGRQPPHLTAKRLTRLRLASDWRDQIAQLEA